MKEEMYCYEKYQGYHIYVMVDTTYEDCSVYYGNIYFNGTCLMSNLKSAISGEDCLTKCIKWVDKEVGDEE